MSSSFSAFSRASSARCRSFWASRRCTWQWPRATKAWGATAWSWDDYYSWTIYRPSTIWLDGHHHLCRHTFHNDEIWLMMKYDEIDDCEYCEWMKFGLVKKGNKSHWCVSRREWGLLIHFTTIHSHASNPQQPIHPLCLAPVSYWILNTLDCAWILSSGMLLDDQSVLVL